jgi:D-erythronate 2-dehydrogenase
LKFVITGAGGFLGRILTTRLLAIWPEAEHRFTLIDPISAAASVDPRVQYLAGALPRVPGYPAAVASADVVFHLSAVPGGAAEQDYEASRSANLDASLDLMRHMTNRSTRGRLVFASSIAVFGAPLPSRIDDTTLPLPSMTYGAHKLMVETELANLTRLGKIDGHALRLPGLVARPGGHSGLRSAFLSELFHACAGQRDFVVPTRPDASVWVMSAHCAAVNLVHAACLAPASVTTRPVVTLPALRVTMRELVAAVARQCDYDVARVRFECDERLEAQFARMPPLVSAMADSLGFRNDGDLDTLVSRALRDAGHGAPRIEQPIR